MLEEHKVGLCDGNRCCLVYPKDGFDVPDKTGRDALGVGYIKIEYRCHLKPHHDGKHKDLHDNEW